MATTPTGAGSEPVPVYLSFTTFRSAVQSLRTHGLPDKLDRTAWNRSGSEQSQIISAFKFLGLIDDAEQTQPILRKLVDAKEDTDDEKKILESLLRIKYSKLFEFDLRTATPGQISESIGSYGPTGATRDRAVRFFLKAADHCGIMLSSRLTRGLRSRSAAPADGPEDENASTPAPVVRVRRRRRSTQEINEPEEERPGNAVKTISLSNTGGTLTLSGTFNPFELDGEDRKLVYDIIDLMKKYEQTKTASE